MANRKRDKLIPFYLSVEEKKILDEKVKISGLTRSSYLRQMALNGYIIKQDLEAIRSITQEINKIGVNINQVVRHINEVGTAQQSEIKYLKEKMDDIWQLLRSELSKTL